MRPNSTEPISVATSCPHFSTPTLVLNLVYSNSEVRRPGNESVHIGVMLDCRETCSIVERRAPAEAVARTWWWHSYLASIKINPFVWGRSYPALSNMKPNLKATSRGPSTSACGVWLRPVGAGDLLVETVRGLRWRSGWCCTKLSPASAGAEFLSHVRADLRRK